MASANRGSKGGRGLVAAKFSRQYSHNLKQGAGREGAGGETNNEVHSLHRKRVVGARGVEASNELPRKGNLAISKAGQTGGRRVWWETRELVEGEGSGIDQRYEREEELTTNRLENVGDLAMLSLRRQTLRIGSAREKKIKYMIVVVVVLVVL